MILPNWGGLRLKAILADEWASMKKKYKEIQKQNMRKLKQSLKVSLDVVQKLFVFDLLEVSIRKFRSP